MSFQVRFVVAILVPRLLRLAVLQSMTVRRVSVTLSYVMMRLSHHRRLLTVTAVEIVINLPMRPALDKSVSPSQRPPVSSLPFMICVHENGFLVGTNDVIVLAGA